MTEVPGAAGTHADGVPSTPYTPDQPAASAKAEPPVDTRGASVYKVKPGDMLSKIAYRNGISSKELAEYNSLSSPDALRVDQTLLIPPYATPRKASVSPRAPSALPETSPITRTATGGTYMVKRGDHLTGIARKHGVTVSAIRAANNMSDDRIYEGKTILIPGGAASTGIFAPKKPAKHISLEGGVQKINSISVGTRNNVKDPVLINSDLGTPVAAGGASPFLSLPSVEPPASATPEPSTLAQAFEYVVQDGETLEDIARAFIVSADDVRTLNALDPKAVVKPGQTLKIPPSIF
jgi:LysM repeat protein